MGPETSQFFSLKGEEIGKQVICSNSHRKLELLLGFGYLNERSPARELEFKDRHSVLSFLV